MGRAAKRAKGRGAGAPKKVLAPPEVALLREAIALLRAVMERDERLLAMALGGRPQPLTPLVRPTPRTGSTQLNPITAADPAPGDLPAPPKNEVPFYTQLRKTGEAEDGLGHRWKLG